MADYRFGAHRYEGSTGRLYRDGVEIPLPPRAAALLEHLLPRAGEVCTKDELLAQVWEGTNVGEESLTQAVSVLRSALDDDPKRPDWLETIPRRGYRFIGAVQPVADAVGHPANGSGAREPDPVSPGNGTGTTVSAGEGTDFRSPAPARRSQLLPWAAAGALFVALVALSWPERASEPPPGTTAPPIRFTIDLGDEPLKPLHDVLAIAPDGSRLALVRPDGIWLREMGAEAIIPVGGTEKGGFPFFSPDGRELIFHRDAALRRVTIAGGMPTPLTTTRGPRGGHWAESGFYFGRSSQGIFRHTIGEDGLELLVQSDAGEAVRDPQLLPGGEWLIYTLGAGDTPWNDARIVAHHLASGELRTLSYGTAVRYVPTGHLVFARNNALWGVPFDADRVEVTGDPVLVVEDVLQLTSGSAEYAVSDNGTLAYLRGVLSRWPARSLKWVAEGGTETVVDIRDGIDNPRLSPDERFIAAIATANNDTAVWLHEIGRSWTLLTSDGHGANPIWSPDGTTVYFESVRGGRSAIWRRSIDFARPAERVWGPPVERVSAPESISPDGRYLYFTTLEDGNIDSWVLDLSGEPTARPIEGLNTRGAAEGSGMIHPSANLLAYVSDESGMPEVYVRELIEPTVAGRRWKVSGAEGGDEPRWSPDGESLYYRFEDQLVAVAVRVSPDFEALDARVLVESLVAERPRSRTEYDVARDGRILISGPEGLDGSMYSRVHVVVNWFSELIERVPSHGVDIQEQ